jgi:iron complex outermembrane recepter protein
MKFTAPVILAALNLGAAPTLAADAADDELDEIVVTATKREQTLQDVPVAVTVTTADTLEKAQIRDILELQSIVPSLRVSQLQTSTQTNFLIRGFGNGANNPGIESSVGVFIDGVYRSRSASQIGDLMDVQRIEVLRGPQSTLFGQNASAGVISVITQKPSFEYGGGAELTVGDRGTRTARARLNGPLSERIAASLTAGVNHRDGYFSNLANGGRINDRDRRDLRLQLLFNVSDDLSLRLIGDTGSVDEKCCGVVNLVNGPTGALVRAIGGNLYTGDPFDRRAYFNSDPINSVNNDGGSLHIDWRRDSITVSSITALRSQETDFNYDSDFTSANLVPTNRNLQSIDTLTQELRVMFDNGGAVTGLLGAYYLNERVKYDNTIGFGANMRAYVTGLIGPASPPCPATVLTCLEASLGIPNGTFFAPGAGSTINARQDSDSYTLFGQMDWKIVDKLTFTGGVAYTNNKKDIRLLQSNSDVFAGLNLVQIGFGGAFSALTGGQAPTPANFALFPAQAALADAISVRPCSATNPPPLCNTALALYPLQFLSPVVPFNNASSDDSKTTYTLRLAYDILDTLKAYGGVSTGFKATSWNLSRDSKPLPPATPDRSPLGGFVNPYYGRYGSRFAGPESSTVYELGLKGQWAHFALNVALFDQQIKGFQSNTFTGTGFTLANAGKQSTKGAEIEAQYTPNRNWEFVFSSSFMDPKYDSFVGAEGPNGPTDLSGSRPAGIHTRSMSTAVTYKWQVGSYDGYARTDYQYANKVQVVENVSAALASRSIGTLNASIGVSRNDWDLQLWAHNLNNDEYLLSAFPSVAQSGSLSGYPNAPRMWGVTVRKTF